MKKKIMIYIFIIGVIFLTFNISYAKENSIVLNKALTDDVEHTFTYPDLTMSSNIKPYSLTLSIENGYFNTSNEKLNSSISDYFDFRGGTNTSNVYVENLNTTEKFKVIAFNLNNSIDISNKKINKKSTTKTTKKVTKKY